MSRVSTRRLTIFDGLLWLVFCEAVLGRSLSSWFTGLGAPQLIKYDDDTGKIFYSLCNSNSTPVFPEDDTAALHLEIPPAKGTSVAGVGYPSEGRNVAAIHYLADSGGIVQALFSCDDTGHYVSTPGQAWIVTADLRPPVLPQPDTDLAALLVGENGGYRIFYKDENFTTSILQYTGASDTSEGRWSYGGHVSQDNSTGVSIHAGFVNRDRLTVVMSDVDRAGNFTVQVATSQEDDWLDESFPYTSSAWRWEDSDKDSVKMRWAEYKPTNYTKDGELNIDGDPDEGFLEAYDGAETRVGLALDSRATRSVFYIGNDSALHRAQEQKGTWRQVDLDADVRGEDEEPEDADENEEHEDAEKDEDADASDRDEEEVKDDEKDEEEKDAKDAGKDEEKDTDKNNSNKSTRKRAADQTNNDESDDERARRHRQLVWPPADTPNADFAVSFDSNQDRIWVFYAVNGSLAQIHQSSAGTWEPAIALPTRNDTASSPGSGSGDVGGADGGGGGEGGEGLSAGGKTGVGVGIGLGLPLASAAVAAYMFLHSRRSRRAREAEFAAVQEAHAAATSPGVGPGPGPDARSWTASPAPGYTSGFWGPGATEGGYWANGQWVVPPYGKVDGGGGVVGDPRYSMQMYSPPPPPGAAGGVSATLQSQHLQEQRQPMLHEMTHQEPMHEVAGDGQVPEMPAPAAPVSPGGDDASGSAQQKQLEK